MMSFRGILMSGVILLLTASCSSFKQSPPSSPNTNPKSETADLVSIKTNDSGPVIPFATDKAFFPLRRDKDGKIAPSYQWRVCKKSFIWCLEWETKKVFFHDLEWFLSNGYGLSKRQKP
jgi:hypothetical protein